MGSSPSSHASNVETLTPELKTLTISPKPNVPDESPEPESREEEPKPKEEKEEEEDNADPSPEEAEESGDAYPHPLRPAEHDCAYYVRSGVCRYGLNCKFNHPPDRMKAKAAEEKEKETSTEMGAQTECKYYMTPGGCKYGDGCNYVHQGKNEEVELNFLGLPLRPGQKECMYYMRTGACKYSTNCRYHHPDPTAVGQHDSLSAYQNGGSPQQHALPAQMPMISWPSQGTPNEPVTCLGAPESFVPGYYLPPHPNQWSGYQVPVNPSYPTGMHVQHPSVASNMKDTSRGASGPAPRKVQTGEYPERPGQAECHFFMKTGICKFKGACKFHHPKSRVPRTPRVVLDTVGPPHRGPLRPVPVNPSYPTGMHVQHPSVASNMKDTSRGASGPAPRKVQTGEYPERPGQAECHFFMKTGICKFKGACKFHHPKSRVPRTPRVVLDTVGPPHRGPLRPDQTVCTHYSRHGICKYGKSCRYNHPTAAVAPTTSSQNDSQDSR